MPGGGSAEAKNRWSGTQLGVGVLGRHRRCSIELAPHGILRLLAENSHLKNGSVKAPWIRLGNKRTTVLHECWVSLQLTCAAVLLHGSCASASVKRC